MAARDLTRWNRAGLARVQYVDGNGAVFLERLRERLHAAYPDWTAARPLEAGTNEGDEAEKVRLETLYQADPDDMLWQLTRAYARACHVLGGTLEAYANEAYLGTASQWDNLRRLVAMLDYAPHPPASAYTPLALQLKSSLAGQVDAGLQIKYTPSDGGKPLTFETLEDLDADAALNVLRPQDYDRNPKALTGARLILPGKLDKLKTGEPLVLEDETSGRLLAYVIQGVAISEDSTEVTLTPPIGRADQLILGRTLVHVLPKEKLRPLGPQTEGAEVGRGLHLANPPDGLAAGDIVAIGRTDAKPIYRRIKAVEDDRLIFHEALGDVDLVNSTINRPITVPIARLGGNKRVIKADGSDQRVLYVAGDWGWLAGRWLADVRHESYGGKMREYLPLYECIKAHYFPVGTPSKTDPAMPHPLAGYTALTLNWKDERDRAADGRDLSLDNPQNLYTTPQTAGPWRPDTFLQKSDAGQLTEPLVTEQPKKTAAGDIAVLVRGGSVAWARLRHVGVDLEAEIARLTSQSAWQERGQGIYYLTSSRIYSHFSEQLRPLDAERNTTPMVQTKLCLDELPDVLKVGRTVLLDNASEALTTTLLEVDAEAEPPWIRLGDAPPSGSTAENLMLYGNVVTAGHGETNPVKILGSGDASRNQQRFLLDVDDASFVADAAMPSGVRADLDVRVGGETWTQVANLGDSGPSDAHYQVRQTEDGLLWVAFGDGRRGRRLPTGSNNVRATYRRGVGSSGNLPASSLAKLARPHALVASVVQPMAASGGGERESVSALRDNAPAALLALERAVSLGDFASLAKANAGVAQARAFALPPGRGQREHVEVVVVPSGGSSLTPTTRDSLEAYLLAHALPGVKVSVAEYTALICAFKVSLRVRLGAFDGETVREAVRQAAVSAFSRDRRALGQTLYRGEVYAAVDAVQGVENSSVEILLAAAVALPRRIARDPNGVILSVRPQERQCVHLDLAEPDLEISVEAFTL